MSVAELQTACGSRLIRLPHGAEAKRNQDAHGVLVCGLSCGRNGDCVPGAGMG